MVEVIGLSGDMFFGWVWSGSANGRIIAETPELLDLRMRYGHNECVMSETEAALRKWITSGAQNLERATIGQLVTLMDLAGAPSVAEIRRKGKGTRNYSNAGVNSRQKLSRLEAALGVGRLTKRVGKGTQLTSAGVRVAGEVRLFLQELQGIAARKADTPRWIIGTGNAWHQSLVIPALAILLKDHPEWRWEVKNMRSVDVRTSLRDGLVHFAVVRDDEVQSEKVFAVGTRVKLETYDLLVGDAADAPKTAKLLIEWVLKEKRPLAQQGSTWPPYRSRVALALKLGDKLEHVEPMIYCESHNQSLGAVEAGNAWSVVPSGLGRTLKTTTRSIPVNLGEASDLVDLVHYPRALRKFPEHDRVWDALTRAIREMARPL